MKRGTIIFLLIVIIIITIEGIMHLIFSALYSFRKETSKCYGHNYNKTSKDMFDKS